VRLLYQDVNRYTFLATSLHNFSKWGVRPTPPIAISKKRAESGDHQQNPSRSRFDCHPFTTPSDTTISCARMSPVAVELAQDLPTAPHQQKQPVVSTSGPTLVIGSPSTAQDGTYPSLISELERDSADAGEVERQMLDRILDGGEFLHALLSPHHRTGSNHTRTQLL